MILLIITLLIVIVVFFLFGKKRNTNPPIDKKLLATYKTILNSHVEYYKKLDSNGKVKFEKLISEFLQYIRIEGVVPKSLISTGC